MTIVPEFNCILHIELLLQYTNDKVSTVQATHKQKWAITIMLCMQLNKLLPVYTMPSAKEHSFHCYFIAEIILYKIFLVFYIHSFIWYIPKHSDSNIQTSSTPNFLHQAMKFAVLSLATKEHG